MAEASESDVLMARYISILVVLIALAAFWGFNITGFATQLDSTNCSATIVDDSALTENMACNTTAIIIGADNVALDCQGYSINYSLNATGVAILAVNRSNITIKNCVMFQTNSSNANAVAINLSAVNNSVVQNNTINTSGTTSYGVQLATGSVNITVRNNTINSNGSSGFGVRVLSSYNNTITGNVISTTGSSATGIVLSTGLNNTASLNTITTTASNALGIFGSARENLSTITSNTIVTAGTFAYPVSLDLCNNFSVSANNLISSNNNSYGIRMSTVTYTNVTSNIVSTSGTTAYGIRLLTNAVWNRLISNTVRTTGSNATGIRLESGSNNTVLNGNNITTNSNFIDVSASSGVNVSAAMMFNTTDGSVYFDGNISLPTTGSISSSALSITSNRIYLNSTNLSFLNTSAQVTLYNLTLNDPQALVDFEDDGTFAACAAPQCTEISYSNGTFVFNVSSFTTYTAEESLVSTCRNLNATNMAYRLSQSVLSAGTCFNITADNVTLDCQGYTVDGSDAAGTYGINSTRNYTTIKNCSITDFDIGIYFEGANYANVTGINASSNVGIYLNGSSGNNFTDTVISPDAVWIYSDDACNSNNFTNTLFNASSGSLPINVSFLLPNATNVSLTNMNISSNRIFLNSTNLTFLNVSARLTLRGLAYADPQALVDLDDDGTFDVCAMPQCTEISYSGGEFTFDVTGFTTYSSRETPVAAPPPSGPAPYTGCYDRRQNCTNWSACTPNGQSRICTYSTANCTLVARIEMQNCTYMPLQLPPVAPCAEDWSCGDWGVCTDGTQTRTCMDRNACNTTANKPAESQACIMPAPPVSPVCGDGTCESGEGYENCPADCAMPFPAPMPIWHVSEALIVVAIAATAALCTALLMLVGEHKKKRLVHRKRKQARR